MAKVAASRGKKVKNDCTYEISIKIIDYKTLIFCVFFYLAVKKQKSPKYETTKYSYQFSYTNKQYTS